MNGTIDLSQLPPPAIIESLDFETIFTQRKNDLIALLPVESRAAVIETLSMESEPLTMLLQASAYRELLLRQRINEADRAVFLASSVGTDLDQLGGNFDLKRFLISPGNPDAVPPVPPVYESDTEYRARIQLSWVRLSTAGPEATYKFFAMSADSDVLDARAYGPETHDRLGVVLLYILSRTGNGTASPALVAKAKAAVNGDEVRPITDLLTVSSAEIVTFAVTAEIQIPYGVDGDVVMAAARADLTKYLSDTQRIGAVVARSGIEGALHQSEVIRVVLGSPATDLDMKMGQAPFCTGVTLTKVLINAE
jgi:phage-related baseplate assembly protein